MYTRAGNGSLLIVSLTSPRYPRSTDMPVRHSTTSVRPKSSPRRNSYKKSLHGLSTGLTFTANIGPAFARLIELGYRIDVQIGLWRMGEGESWLRGADWVVDAIDNIETKVDLLTHCRKQGIKVFSSMGSGAKRDPTRVQIASVLVGDFEIWPLMWPRSGISPILMRIRWHGL